MPNPYQARGPVRVGREVASELDTLLARLEKLGATADELDQVREGWDDLDDDWTVETRHRFAGASDDELVAAIAGVREEYRLHTTTVEDDAAEHERRTDAALAEGVAVYSQSIPAVMTWVGGDDARAYAIHSLESQRPEPRKTLIEAVETRAGAWAAKAQ
jgi:hypothetical protein